MPIPNGSGGYQYTSGNPAEVVLGVQATPATNIGASATLTAAQLASGILLVGASQTTAQTFTLPSASGLDTATNAVVPNARVGSTFELVVINTGTTSGTAALSMGSGTGFTDGGNATVAVAVTASARFLFRKTADATWTVYRV